MAGRKWTDAQRAAARERWRAKNAQAPEAEPIQQETEDENETAAALRLLAGALDKQEKKKSAVAQIEAALGQLDFKSSPELLDNPVIQNLLEQMQQREGEKQQSKEDPPGTVYTKTLTNGMIVQSDKPWTYADLKHPKWGCKWIKVVPPESTLVIWNGLHWYLFQDEEQTIPEVFWSTYQDSRVQRRFARRNAEFLMGLTNESTPDMTHAEGGGPGAALVRAFGKGSISIGTAGLEAREIPAGVDVQPGEAVNPNAQ